MIIHLKYIFIVITTFYLGWAPAHLNLHFPLSVPAVISEGVGWTSEETAEQKEERTSQNQT